MSRRVAAQYEACYYFLPLEHWNRGFESRSVLLCSRLYVALRREQFQTHSPRSPNKYQHGKTRKKADCFGRVRPIILQTQEKQRILHKKEHRYCFSCPSNTVVTIIGVMNSGGVQGIKKPGTLLLKQLVQGGKFHRVCDRNSRGLRFWISQIAKYMIYDIFVNCNWVATRWQQYSTHLHTNNTQNDTKQTMHRTTQKF